MARPKIRVCQLTPSLWSGGTEERIARIQASLDRSQFDLAWLGFGPARESLTERAGSDVRIVPIARHAEEGIEVGVIPRIAAELVKLRPDLIHVHNWSTSLYGIAGARLAGVPGVLFGLGGQNEAEGPPARRIRVMRALTPHVDRFTAVCEYLGHQFEEYWRAPREKIRVLQTGIDIQEIDGAPERAVVRENLGLPQDAIVVGAISVFRAVKKLDDMIAAANLAAKRDPRIHFVLVGNPLGVSTESLVDSPAAIELGERFHLFGRVEHPADRLPVFDVVMNTSSFEGASNAIIEAMGARIPVVATRVGGTPELVDHGVHGLLTEPGDVPALADALVKLAADPALRAQMGEAGRQRVEERHTYAAMTAAYAGLYRELAEDARGSRFERASRTLKDLGAGFRAASSPGRR